MKTIFNKTFIAAAVAATALASCDSDVFNINSDPFKGSTYKSDLTSPISILIDGNEDFSEYAEALRYSDTYSALNQCTTGTFFTAFVPTNDAMHEFYQRRGVSRLQDLTPGYVKQFVLYHTAGSAISGEDFIKENYSVTNLLGDILKVSIDSDRAGEARLGDEARVVHMADSAYNGFIYTLSRVNTPLVETVYDRVAEDPSSSIMREALEATGWSKQLSTLADTTVVDGKKMITKRYYTLLSVSDATFAKDGISNLAGLKSKLAADDQKGVGADSLLNEFVAYHVMRSATTIADLGNADGNSTSSILGSTAKNQVIALDFDGEATSLGERYVFNRDGQSARFVEGKTDIRARNGYVHQIDGYLPVWEPEQAEVIWNFGDYPEIKGIVDPELYQPETPNTKEPKTAIESAACFNYMVGEAGTKTNTYSTISYVTSTSWKNRVDGQIVESACHKNDRVVFNLGYMGWCEMNTPTLVKGKYRVELTVAYISALAFMQAQTDGNGGLVKMTFDDREDMQVFTAPYTKVPSKTSYGTHTSVIFDEVDFDVTSPHTFKFTVMDPAASSHNGFSLQFDNIRFIPIK